MNRTINFQFIVITILFSLPLMGLGLWWGVLLSTLVAALFTKIPASGRLVLLGFICGFLVWFLWSMIGYLDGGQIISQRIGGLFGLHPILLLVVAGMIGGILGLVGALAGSFRRFW